MNQSKIFIIFVMCFALGILIESAFFVEPVFFYFGVGLSAMGFAITQSIGIKKSFIIFGCIVCLSFGALRLNQTIIENPFTDSHGQKVTLEGYIVEDPSIKQNGQQLVFLPNGYSQNIQLSTTLTQKFFYGDYVVVTGKINEAKNINDFDYQSYLERFNIYAVSNYPKILILKSGGLYWAKNALLKIKYGFLNRLDNLYTEPQKSLLLGILIGGHGTLPKNVAENFNKTGTSHIIAVSGYNVTIIISALFFLSYIFGRRSSFWLSILTIISFVIITGASASVVRAGIMGFLLSLSAYSGRQYSVAPSLFAAALVMLIINPKILFWDVGFQLSFAATLGIIYFLPLLNSLTENWPKFFGAKTIVLGTMAAIVATLPIILFNFGLLSLTAPLVNVLILPLVPATMFFGFFSALPIIGPGFAMIANWCLIYILRVTQFFGNLPHTSLNIKISPTFFWLIIGAILCFYGVLFRLNKKIKTEKTNN